MVPKISNFESFLRESQQKEELKIVASTLEEIKKDSRLLNKLKDSEMLDSIRPQEYLDKKEDLKNDGSDPLYSFTIYLTLTPLRRFLNYLDKWHISIVPDHFSAKSHLIVTFKQEEELNPGEIEVDEWAKTYTGAKAFSVKFNARNYAELIEVIEEAYKQIASIVSRVRVVGGYDIPGPLGNHLKAKIKERYKESINEILSGEGTDIKEKTVGDLLVSCFAEHPEEVVNFYKLPEEIQEEVLNSDFVKDLKGEAFKKIKSLANAKKIEKYY